MQKKSKVTIMAGIPATNATFYHAIRFSVGDPAAWIKIETDGQPTETLLILRDIEMGRARQNARVDHVFCPADFQPDSGLSGNRELATAQATAECLHQKGIAAIVADRSLPLIFADVIRQRGISVVCDYELGITQRRSKTPEEIKWLQEAQATTESTVEMACRMIARCDTGEDGVLIHEGQPLTSERVRFAIDVWLLERDYSNPNCIVAGGSQGADCHSTGSGQLKTGEPIIVDIFPQCRATHYNGDCTRTVVHGRISEPLQRMHAAVAAAKQAGQNATRPGVTGEAVHQSVIDTIRQHGFEIGLPDENASDDYCAMVHGTGHGVGLEVHEAPLLDFKGPPLVVGEVLTIEPGLYCNGIGGIRLEDMVVVTENGCESLNRLPESLSWDG